jgi:hypothetical protein
MTVAEAGVGVRDGHAAVATAGTGAVLAMEQGGAGGDWDRRFRIHGVPFAFRGVLTDKKSDSPNSALR